MRELRYLLGERIRTIRNEKGLSQEELGEKAGLHYTYVGAIERGEKNCSVGALEKFANGLHVSVQELFAFPESAAQVARLKKDIIAQIEESSPETLRLLSLFLLNLKTRQSKSKEKTSKKY